MQLHDSAFCLPLAAWASPRNLATVLFLMSVVLFFRPVALTPKGDVRTLEEKARGNFFSRRGNEHERLNLSKKGDAEMPQKSPRVLTSVTTSLTRSSAPLATFPRASITPSRVSLALFDITTTVGGLMAESHDSLAAAAAATGGASDRHCTDRQSHCHSLPDAERSFLLLRRQRTMTRSLSLNHTLSNPP